VLVSVRKRRRSLKKVELGGSSNRVGAAQQPSSQRWRVCGARTGPISSSPPPAADHVDVLARHCRGVPGALQDGGLVPPRQLGLDAGPSRCAGRHRRPRVASVSGASAGR
jgi:hypothetical protein